MAIPTRKKSFSAPIEDEKWLEEFHKGEHPITPGQALRVRVRFDHKYDRNGDLKESKEAIVKVLGVIQAESPPKDLFESNT